MERITIIGMSPIGVSMGLALKRSRLNNTEVVGSSGDKSVLSTAAKMGAMDRDINNLREAVRGAQLIVLDLPFAQMREMLDAIAPIAEDGCVITDTGTTKVRVMHWAEDLLPKGVSFVGGHPLVKDKLEHIEEARSSLFEGVNYCVMPSGSADEQSVKTVVGLVELVGARPLFLDPHEHDSYAVAMEILPTVLSSALVATTAGSESWREMHKLATSTFDDYSRLASSDPLDNEAAFFANSEALVHWIDQFITQLYTFRNQIKEQSDDLIESLIKAWEERARWEAGAVEPKEGPSLPGARESMATAFFGERLTRRYQEMTGGGEKKESWKYTR